jgi:hypothetical protein
MQNPGTLHPVADDAGHTTDTAGPGVERRIGPDVPRQVQADAGGRHLDRADGAQGGPRLRIETFEGLRKPAVSLPSDRPQQVLGSVGVGGLDFLDRPIEVSEDPADFFFQEVEARGSEPIDRFAARLSKFLRPETIRGFQIRWYAGIGYRNEAGVRCCRIHLPRGACGR